MEEQLEPINQLHIDGEKMAAPVYYLYGAIFLGCSNSFEITEWTKNGDAKCLGIIENPGAVRGWTFVNEIML